MKIDVTRGKKSNDEFHPCAIVQFYSAEFVCAADCLSRSEDRGNESELKRSIKNVNSPNWDVKWRITASENGRDPTNHSRLSLIAREANPRLDTFTELKVGKARAKIIGQADIYVKTGSLLTLTCLMSQGPHDLGTVAWYQGSEAVVTSPRSENDIETEPRITVETEWSDALTSRLKITHAKFTDSGKYSCVPTVAEGASVNVHVINGKSIRNTITDPHDKIIRVHASITYPTILGDRVAAIHPTFV
ncbi:hypothetical protein ALC57_08224 [Trachymyrmex cornetzi]|uniref:Ig-like domain-containing protein n=1 Tax=Trachymyrmex cornetzi TaxID=471704 RepID=A0A195E3F9_9HYME|nr:hypothetical protein ALC57_08224 [Trachymyrmex cornetzi]